MTSILAAVSKLKGCVNQIQNKNPSGASEQKILNQAKILQTQDEKYKKGFQFDHVWPILKGIEKFANNFSNRANALQEEVQNVISSPSLQEESSSSPCMNSFDLNMNKEDVTSNLSKRSMGVKKQRENNNLRNNLNK
ncbi:unnamed protein product [Brassica oleracea var. botrytis]